MDFINLSMILICYLIAITLLSKVLLVPVTILFTIALGSFFKSSKEKLEKFLNLLVEKKSIAIIYFSTIYTFATLLASVITVPILYSLVTSYIELNINTYLYLIIPLIALTRNIIMVVYKKDSIKVIVNGKK